MIMSANGVPDSLFNEIFQDQLRRVSGISERAKRRALTKDDKNSMKSFTTVGQTARHTSDSSSRSRTSSRMGSTPTPSCRTLCA